MGWPRRYVLHTLPILVVKNKIIFLGYSQGGPGPWNQGGGGGGPDAFGNNYQQSYGGGAVRNNYQNQRPAPYSK